MDSLRITLRASDDALEIPLAGRVVLERDRDNALRTYLNEQLSVFESGQIQVGVINGTLQFTSKDKAAFRVDLTDEMGVTYSPETVRSRTIKRTT